jgi:hypothetical protein
MDQGLAHQRLCEVLTLFFLIGHLKMEATELIGTIKFNLKII